MHDRAKAELQDSFGSSDDDEDDHHGDTSPVNMVKKGKARGHSSSEEDSGSEKEDKKEDIELLSRAEFLKLANEESKLQNDVKGTAKIALFGKVAVASNTLEDG